MLKDVNLMLFFSYFCLYMLLSAASLNVDGLRSNLKRKTIFCFLKQKQYSIMLLLLQETHSTPADEKLWICKSVGKIIFAHGDNHIRGVAVLLKNSFKPKIEKVICDSNDSYLLLQVAINYKILVLGNIYSPTKDEPAFFDSLFLAISDFAKSDIILEGNWNVILDDQLDKDQGSIHSNKKVKEKLKSCVNCFNLQDIFRELHPSKKAYTRFQARRYTAAR